MSVTFVFTPRDGLFFKDGRGWSVTGARSPSLGWPFPSTILGAVRSAWGRAVETVEGGHVFTQADWAARTAPIELDLALPVRRPRGATAWRSEHRMWPVPSDALHLERSANVVMLTPDPPNAKTKTLGRDDDDARESLWRAYPKSADKPEPPPEWWTDAEWRTWLEGGNVARLADPDAKAERDLPVRRDVHIALDRTTGTAADGALFESEVREPLSSRWEWGILTRVSLPPAPVVDLADGVVLLGNDRRTARAEPADASLFAPPSNAGGPSRGVRVVQATPACFERGWLPDGFAVSKDTGEYIGSLPGLADGVVLRAAMVSRPEHVSGWSMERGGPKRTRRLVPAGSVYFFEKVNKGEFTEAERRALWLAAWGRDVAEGFGRIVAGIWKF